MPRSCGLKSALRYENCGLRGVRQQFLLKSFQNSRTTKEADSGGLGISQNVQTRNTELESSVFPLTRNTVLVPHDGACRGILTEPPWRFTRCELLAQAAVALRNSGVRIEARRMLGKVASCIITISKKDPLRCQ